MKESKMIRIQYTNKDVKSSLTIDETIFNALEIETGNALKWVRQEAVKAHRENTTGRNIVSSCVRRRALELLLKPNIQAQLDCNFRFQDKLNMLGKSNAGQYKRIECNDGFSISIQASRFHYSEPRKDFDDANQYSHFELGFPSEEEEMIEMLAEDMERLTDTVYPYVEANLIQDMLDKHGGIKG